MFGETFKGDGTSHKFDATFGANLADERGNVTVSASYTKRDPVFMQNRSFSRVPLDTIGGQLVPGGSGNIPGTRIGLSAGQLAGLTGVNLTPSGACTSVIGVRFGQNGTPLPFCNPQDRFNYAAGNFLLRPLERIQISALTHYDISDNVGAYGEAFYMNNRNEFQQAPDAFTPLTPGAASGTLLVPNYATNPILLPAVRAFFVNNQALFDPDGDGTAAIVGAGRRANELGPRNYAFERASVSFTGGLRGKFELLDHEWNWDSFFQYQRTRTDQRREGIISQSRLSQALNAITNGSGQVVCADASRGCVPVSIFGLDTITPAAGKFLTPPRIDKEEFTRKVAGVSLSGALFALPAGPVAVALGAEYREDEYNFEPSPQDLAGEYGGASQGALAGKYDLKEVFGELRVPIFKEQPFAHSLSIEGAARFSDYSSIGSAFTWKLGGEYAPIEWLRVRGAYNRAIRAPSIGELFSPVSRGFSSGDDPCSRSRNPTAAQQQLCIAQGIRPTDIPTFEQNTVGFEVLSGGNPNLQEEKSETYTIGAVISPPFARGLNLTVDYFNVKVDNAISTIGPNQTLDDCFRRLDSNAPTCQAIRRLSNGQIDFVSTQSSNIGSLKVRGLDVQLDYVLNLPDAVSIGGEGARLKLNAFASWLFENSSQVISGEPPIDCAGRVGRGCSGLGIFATPDFKLNLSGQYQSGPLSVRLQGRMIGEMRLYPGASAAVTKADAQWYFDLSSQVKIHENVEFFGGIDNLFDKQPPILGTSLAGDANTDPSLYDVIGRRFFIGARLKF